MKRWIPPELLWAALGLTVTFIELLGVLFLVLLMFATILS
jgi:hypothetical protein